MKHASAFLELVEECKPRVQEISVDEVAALQAARVDFLLIDVREDSEWAAGHAVGNSIPSPSALSA